MFFALILIQNKLGAQVQNNSSLQNNFSQSTTPVNINNDVNHKSFTSINIGVSSNSQSLAPSGNIKNITNSQDSSNVELILPQVIDPATMDRKPE